MSKALMISIRPEHAYNILNGKKTLELRTWTPKGYVGWVYVYVTKGKPYIVDFRETSMMNQKYELFKNKKNVLGILKNKVLNGKVVARFWFDETYYIKQAVNVYGDELNQISIYDNKSYGWKAPKEQQEILKQLCLTEQEVLDYVKGKEANAWNIKQLEIFDEPKSLSEFYVTNKGLTYKAIKEYEAQTNDTVSFRLKKAPQKMVWVYVKEEENE